MTREFIISIEGTSSPYSTDAFKVLVLLEALQDVEFGEERVTRRIEEDTFDNTDLIRFFANGVVVQDVQVVAGDVAILSDLNFLPMFTKGNTLNDYSTAIAQVEQAFSTWSGTVEGVNELILDKNTQEKLSIDYTLS